MSGTEDGIEKVIDADNDNSGMQDHQASAQGNKVPKQPEASAPNEHSTPAEDKAAEDAADKTSDDDTDGDDDAPLDTTIWPDTGSETGNAVLQLLQNSGATTGEAKELLYDAIVAGGYENIDKEKLEEKFGKVKSHLILAGVKTYLQEQNASAQAIVSDIHKTVGGEGNWKTIVGWATTSVEEKDLDQYRTMIDAGGVQARLAAKELQALYNADENNTTLGGDTKEVQAKGGAPRQSSIEPMNAATYADKLSKLYNEHMGNPPVHLRQQLLNARNRGKAMGL